MKDGFAPFSTETPGRLEAAGTTTDDMTQHEYRRFRHKALRGGGTDRITAPLSRDALLGGPFRQLVPHVPGRGVALTKTGWDSLKLLAPGLRQHFLGRAPLVNFFRKDPAARAFDLLRTRLLQTLRMYGWQRVAVASPTHGCGSTFTAVNLGQSLARVSGSRTVLMDLNLRTPGVARALDLSSVGNVRAFLSGGIPVDAHIHRINATQAVGLAAAPDPDAAELLHGQRCAEALDQMVESLRPDVVLYDLPPILVYDDLAAFLPQVDGVLLVADGTRTLPRHIAACEQILKGQTQLLGVVLNRARRPGPDNRLGDGAS